jgi:3-oxoadipate enol-lactonase
VAQGTSGAGHDLHGPPLPPGRRLALPDRGTTFVREVAGPPGAPTVVLLHGWMATADINFFTCYEHLGRRFRVVAMDHRGHGCGIKTRKPFRLEDCADDAVAVLDQLGVSRAVFVGYSMGGPIAQLVWRRHPQRVQGLVLCATAGRFNNTQGERVSFLGLSTVARAARLSPPFARSWLGAQVLQRRGRDYHDWAYEQIRHNDWTTVLEAGRAIGSFSSRAWIGDVDVPSAVIVTQRDQLVPPQRQRGLLAALPHARGYAVDAGHDAVIARPDVFVPTLVAACTNVVERSRIEA